ncbi:hypothetical protein J6590_059598, partial [Homalodisca vitripennis]
MRVLWFLGFCCWDLAMTVAILVSGNGTAGAVGKSADEKKTTDDPIVSQESNQRSAVYPGYFADDLHDHPEHYSYNYEPSYYPHHVDHHLNHVEHHPHHVEHHPHHVEHHPHHYPQHDGLRALLIPLAGVALLGAAAVFASNPILLQLGVVSGRRRRRELAEQPFQEIKLLRAVLEQLPREEVARQERRLLAGYLSCSDWGSGCVERLACETHSPASPVTPTERNVVD